VLKLTAQLIQYIKPIPGADDQLFITKW